MRLFLKSNVVPVLFGWLIFACPLHSQEVKSPILDGYWKFKETFDGGAGKAPVAWSFELVDEGRSTLIAVGRRSEIIDRTTAILFIDVLDDGTFRGSLIQAEGDGKQIELSLDIEINDEGTEVSMEAFDRGGSKVSKFEGQWLGKGRQAAFQSGEWEVREIVSPGNGSWDIEWKFKFKGAGAKISGLGNKSIVNGRKAYPGETKTHCQIDFKRIPEITNAIEGKGVETNAKGRKSRTNYEGWVSPSGKTFFVMVYESTGLAALIVGRYEG